MFAVLTSALQQIRTTYAVLKALVFKMIGAKIHILSSYCTLLFWTISDYKTHTKHKTINYIMLLRLILRILCYTFLYVWFIIVPIQNVSKSCYVFLVLFSEFSKSCQDTEKQSLITDVLQDWFNVGLITH